MKNVKFLKFELTKDTGKTKVFLVKNIMSGCPLAYVRWYPAWRRYTLIPHPNTIWDINCMKEVIEFIEGLMEERKK